MSDKNSKDIRYSPVKSIIYGLRFAIFVTYIVTSVISALLAWSLGYASMNHFDESKVSESATILGADLIFSLLMFNLAGRISAIYVPLKDK